MRILMVAARYFPFAGGIETHLHEVGPRLVARGHEVEILTTDPTRALPAEEVVAGMRVRRVWAWPQQRDYYFAPGVYTAVRRGDWDVIHIQGYSTFVAPLGLLAARGRDVPLVLTFHSGGHSSSLRNVTRVLQHAALLPLLRDAAALIGVSEFEADFFCRRMHLPRERFLVVPNGAAMPAPSAGVRPDPGLLVSVGRLERYKGHHRVIAAMPHLIRQVPEARLLVLGAGPYEGCLRNQIQSLGMERRVTITAVPPGERQRMADLVAGAGLFVLLSDYEAHPIAVMEALALRRPVLVAETPGLRELAARGWCSSVPLRRSPADTAAAIAHALRQPCCPAHLRLPDWDECARALEQVYERVCRFRHAGRKRAAAVAAR